MACNIIEEHLTQFMIAPTTLWGEPSTDTRCHIHIGRRARDLIQEICQDNGVEIIRGKGGNIYEVLDISSAQKETLMDQMIKAYIEKEESREESFGDFKVEKLSILC